MDKRLIKIIKIASVVASVLGVIGSSFADSQENKLALKELVDSHFNNEGE